MPTLSKKGMGMPASPIRKLVPYAEIAKEKGVKVIHLNIGQPDINTPEVVKERMRNYDLDVIEYSHSAGIRSYREGLAKYYGKFGISLSYENIMVTTGGSEALTITFGTCFDNGDEVIIPEPFYANYNGFANSMGVNVVPITANIEDDFALPPIEAFEEKISDKTKGIMVCNPGNPTGCVYSKEEMQKLKKLAQKHDLYLIADEVYREFCYGGEVPTSALELEGVDNNVIVVDSVSKRYSMCGARIGALITRNKDVMNTALKFAQARLSPPTLGQIAAEAALATPQQYFDDVTSEYIKRRDFLVEELNKIPGVLCPKPGGAFYAIARLPIDDSDKFAQWLLEDFNHNDKTVMVAPASGFYATPGKGKDEVRIAYVLNMNELKDAINCLKHALDTYPGRTS